MARSGSPQRMNGYEEDQLLQDFHFSQDVNEQMRVPKRIKATGECFDEHELLGNGNMNSWNYHEKLDMTVPDRIVVMGQDQHLGTRSAPREIILDNQILPTDPGFVRVQTPPRVISLSQHHFPSANDEPRNGPLNGEDDSSLSQTNENDDRILVKPKKLNYIPELMVNHSRGETPPIGPSGEGLTPSEEVVHLRRQVVKLNRRVLAIEFDAVQRQQKDKIVYCIGLAYFLLKAIWWLNKN